MSNPWLFRKAYVRARKQTEIRKQNKVQTWWIEEFRPETGGLVFKEGNLSTGTADWGQWVLDSRSCSDESRQDRQSFIDPVTPQEASGQGQTSLSGLQRHVGLHPLLLCTSTGSLACAGQELELVYHHCHIWPYPWGITNPSCVITILDDSSQNLNILKISQLLSSLMMD